MYTLRLQSYSKGEVIFTEGTPGSDAFVVHEGEVEILKSGPKRQPVSIRVLGPGEMFGEMAIVTQNPRAATAVARTDVSLEVIDRESFALKIRSDPEFAMATVQRLSSMIPEAQARFLLQMETETETDGSEGRGLRRILGRRREDRPDSDAFAPDFVRIENEPVPMMVRYAGAVILGLMVSVVAWATVATTDTVVTGTGRIVTTVPNIAVQPFEIGVVREVRVAPGQAVRKGDVLATLDPTIAQADVLSAQSQLASTQAQVARLRAELAGQEPERFSADASEDAVQRQLFRARREQYRATLSSHEEDLRSLDSQIAAREREARELEDQLRTLREITAIREQFFRNESEAFLKEGQYRLQYLDSKRALAAAERDMTQLRSALSSLRTQVRAKRLQRDAWAGDWQARLNQELVSATRDLARLTEQARKADRANALIELVAPADAVVLSVRTRTQGTVVRPGDPLIELVPADVTMEIEADVSPRDVARIRPGDPVSIKVDALPFTKHGMIDGELRLVSEDTFERTTAGQPGPVYRARVTIGQSHLVGIPSDFRLFPGMTVAADVKTGQRSLITYITYPIYRALNTSFREP